MPFSAPLEEKSSKTSISETTPALRGAMGDDWDPFADPGDGDDAPTQAVQPSKAGYASKRKVESDIFAALRQPELPETVASVDPQDVQRRLDALFSMDDSSEHLAREFAGLAECQGQHFFPMWRRAAPMLENAEASNLLGLMIDDALGLSVDPSTNQKNDVFLEQGQAGEVVFLLAWGGSNVMDVQDMIDFYRELLPGCTIFVSTSNQKQSFGLRCQCAMGIRAAAQAWTHGGEPKLLVHLFSNSGAHAWAELLQSWEKLQGVDLKELGLGPLPPMHQVLRGVLLDSAPNGAVSHEACVQSLVQSVAAVVSLALASDHDGSEEGRKEAELRSRRAVGAIIGGQSVVKRYLAAKPAKMLTKLANAETAVIHALEPPVPMQFIYSKDDNIIEAHGVEQYLQEVNAREKRKGLAQPRVWCIEKSRHCMHKVGRPEEVREALCL